MGWRHPRKDSVTSFALNEAKFVPSLMAMDPLSIATSFYPATLLVLNAAVSIMLLLRRRAAFLFSAAGGVPPPTEIGRFDFFIVQ